ncbi:MAG: hypothetical protein J6T39_01370, partial [Clostridia bacterium]|nr:hypothetical protein [Clostridia bacterium]
MNSLFLVKLKKNWKKVAIVMALLLSFVAMALLFIPTKEVSLTSAATLPTDYWSSYQSSSYYDSGSGTEASPYLISTPGQLAKLSAVYNAGSITSKKYFKLTENINLSKHLWVPIGTEAHPFNGVIDGNDKAIAGLTQNTALVYAGLIGYAGEIEVKNLNLSGVNITNTSTTQGAVGALVGIINSSSYTAKFSNIVVTGLLETKTNYPSTKDSLGSVIGSILACKSGSIIENVSVNTSLRAENRSVNTTVNPLIGFIQSTNSNLTVRNSFAQSLIFVGDRIIDCKKYEGDFGGSSTNALWTFDSRLNNGLPILKNNYWITAANPTPYNKTGTQLVSQLTTLGFSTGLLITTTVYTLTKNAPLHGNYTMTSRDGTSVSYGTMSVVYGARINVTPTADTGYSFSSISVSPTTTYPTTTSFIMPNDNATLTVNFTPNPYT